MTTPRRRPPPRPASQDSALIAGHGDTAQALSNLSAGVPLNWTRDNHRQWPAALKQAGAQLVAGLAGAPWFHALPGAARCAVVDACMQQVAQQTVWPMVPERFWSEGFAPLVPLPLMIAARDVAERGVTGVDQPWRGADGGALGAPDAGMGGLQFIVTRPRRGWAHALSGAAKLLARCATTVFGITQLCNITQHAPGHLKLAVVLLIATQVMTTGSGGRRR